MCTLATSLILGQSSHFCPPSWPPRDGNAGPGDPRSSGRTRVPRKAAGRRRGGGDRVARRLRGGPSLAPAPGPRGPCFPCAPTPVGGRSRAARARGLGSAENRGHPGPPLDTPPTRGHVLWSSECGRKRLGGGRNPTWLRVEVGFSHVAWPPKD